jgi:DNA anti-recombination protein RmuC
MFILPYNSSPSMGGTGFSAEMIFAAIKGDSLLTRNEQATERAEERFDTRAAKGDKDAVEVTDRRYSSRSRRVNDAQKYQDISKKFRAETHRRGGKKLDSMIKKLDKFLHQLENSKKGKGKGKKHGIEKNIAKLEDTIQNQVANDNDDDRDSKKVKGPKAEGPKGKDPKVKAPKGEDNKPVTVAELAIVEEAVTESLSAVTEEVSLIDETMDAVGDTLGFVSQALSSVEQSISNQQDVTNSILDKLESLESTSSRTQTTTVDKTKAQLLREANIYSSAGMYTNSTFNLSSLGAYFL